MHKWTGSIAGCLIIAASYAADPVVQTKFTADPAPLVHDGTVYLYTGHDDDNAPPGMAQFRMRDWLCYTSMDLVNWTDRGTVATLKNFDWTGWGGYENGAWASQAIARNGKVYLYVTVQGAGIGVLVADGPLGPFTDPLGKPLIGPQYDSIDPSVFIDDDGQAYLYWGNPNLWYVKLNEDMISLAGEITKDSLVRKEAGKPDSFHFQEAPWVWKRDGRYYNAYASTCCPEGIGYAMSDSATGPWEYKGYIMPPDRRSSGNHPGVVEFKGKWYVFGFNYKLNFRKTDRHHERRSVCVTEIMYNQDGTIQQLPWWEEADAVEQIKPLNPYVRVEAETIAWSEGIKTESCSAGGMNVCDIENKDYIKVKGVDFGAGAASFRAAVASKTNGGVIEIRLDSLEGPVVGTCAISGTGDWQNWTTTDCSVRDASGVHDLYLVFSGGGGKLFNCDWWHFESK